MFGVDSRGNDVLAMQFNAGGGAVEGWSFPGGVSEELKLLYEQNLKFLRQSLGQIREFVLRQMEHAGVVTSEEHDISRRVEEELKRRAMRLAKEGLQEQQVMASQAAVLRT